MRWDLGQVLVKVTWISLDPVMRSWLADNKRAYVPPVQPSNIMRAAGLGVVVKAGEGGKFSVGDKVSGVLGESRIKSPLSSELTRGMYPQVGGSTLCLAINWPPSFRSCSVLLCEFRGIYSHESLELFLLPKHWTSSALLAIWV